MKKIIAMAALATVVATSSFAQENGNSRQPGGFVSGVIGCCFGIRAAADYNGGKDLHWMEWGRLIPIFGIYVAVMNFIDGNNGLTREDIRKNMAPIVSNGNTR